MPAHFQWPACFGRHTANNHHHNYTAILQIVYKWFSIYFRELEARTENEIEKKSDANKEFFKFICFTLKDRNRNERRAGWEICYMVAYKKKKKSRIRILLIRLVRRKKKNENKHRRIRKQGENDANKQTMRKNESDSDGRRGFNCCYCQGACAMCPAHK